jgi:hypothetical protein
MPDKSSNSVKVLFADKEQLPAGPGCFWSALLFTYLEIAAMEACQGMIQDPVSGEPWRFMFRKEGNRMQLRKIGEISLTEERA